MAKKHSTTKPAPKAAFAVGPTVTTVSPTGLSMVARGTTVTAVFTAVPPPGDTCTVTAVLIAYDAMNPPAVTTSLGTIAPSTPGGTTYNVSAMLPNGMVQYTIVLTATDDQTGGTGTASAYYWTT